MRAIVYGGGLDMPRIARKYNLLVYQNDSIRLNPQRYFQIIKRIADMAYKNGDYRESIKYATEGIAEESGITNIRTIQRLFQLKTGMTPTEYRNAIHP